MDFLDSLDLQTNHKSNRMRSWYLYEQYKSLERHQLDAAERLKNRSYQERLLHRELAERRSRRRLYQQCGLSEHSADRHGVHSALDFSTDNFFESYCELNDDIQSVSDSVAGDSPPDTEIDKAVMEDYKSVDIQDDTSCAESMTSVVTKNETFDEEYKSVTEKLESVQRNIADKISQQLETVKENMLCLEKYARLSDTEDEAGHRAVRPGSKPEAFKRDDCFHDTSLYTMWSRLVSFAYQIIQLNHGNCYYDYSSQLMTAVLACDVLRRGVNSMCDNLQPYVSPIKFIEANDDSPRKTFKKAKRKNCIKSKGTSESRQVKINSSVYKSARSHGGKHSVNPWQRCSNSYGNKERRNTVREMEPWRQQASGQTSSSERYWPKEPEREGCQCFCHCSEIVNPMLKLVRHLDNVLKSDIDFFVHR